MQQKFFFVLKEKPVSLKKIVFHVCAKVFSLPLQFHSPHFSILLSVAGRPVWTMSMVSLAFWLLAGFGQGGALTGSQRKGGEGLGIYFSSW